MSNKNLMYPVEENTGDVFLRDLQEFKQRIEKKLSECRDNLQNTVDGISLLEKQREVEKISIIKQFEIVEKELIEMVSKRRTQLLELLDKEMDMRINELLERTKVYQQQITEGIHLQPSLSQLEEIEKSNSLIVTNTTQKDVMNSNSRFPNTIINDNSNSALANKSRLPPSEKPPPLPATIQSQPTKSSIWSPHQNIEPITTFSKKRLVEEIRKYLIAKPPAALQPVVAFEHNRIVFLKDINKRIDKFGWIASSTGSYSDDIKVQMKDRLDWIGQYTNSLTNIFWSRKEEITELKEIPPPLLLIYLGIERQLAEEFVEKFTITASRMPSGCVIPIINFDDEHSVKQWLSCSEDINTSHQIKSVKKKNGGFRIPGLNLLQDKYENEEEVQIIAKGNNQTTNEDCNNKNNDNGNDKNKDDDDNKEKKILEENITVTEEVSTTTVRKRAMKPSLFPISPKKQLQSKIQRIPKKKLFGDTDENEDEENEYGYQYNNNNNTYTKQTNYQYSKHEKKDMELRAVLRACLLLYKSDQFTSEEINQKIELWNNKYRLRSMFAIEMRDVKYQPVLDTDSPDNFLACVFYDENGIIFGQDTIFDSIADTVFPSKSM